MEPVPRLPTRQHSDDERACWWTGSFLKDVGAALTPVSAGSCVTAAQHRMVDISTTRAVCFLLQVELGEDNAWSVNRLKRRCACRTDVLAYQPACFVAALSALLATCLVRQQAAAQCYSTSSPLAIQIC